MKAAQTASTVSVDATMVARDIGIEVRRFG
jgi:hypothetical protein